PGGHRGLGREVTDAPAHATALPGLDLVAPHEPGVPAATRPHPLPDPLLRGLDVDVPSDLELVRHASILRPLMIATAGPGPCPNGAPKKSADPRFGRIRWGV